MIRKYNLNCKTIAYFLLLSLFLQSCLNQPISPISLAKKQSISTSEVSGERKLAQIDYYERIESMYPSINTNNTNVAESKALIVAESRSQVSQRKEATASSNAPQRFANDSKKDLVRRSINPVIKKTPREKKTRKTLHYVRSNLNGTIKNKSNKGSLYVFVTRQGQRISIYQQEEKWQAKIKEKTGVFKRKTNPLPVYFEPGTSLEKLASLPKSTQESYLYVESSKPSVGQSGYVYIGPMVLLGGGKEDKEIKKKTIEEKEKQEKKVLDEEGEKEDCGNQYQLQEKAYQAQQYQNAEEIVYAITKWLDKAAAQGHEEAKALLETFNQMNCLNNPHLENKKNLEEDNKRKEEEKLEQSFFYDLENYHYILEFARKGDVQAQFQLGAIAYRAWEEQYAQKPTYEVKALLNKGTDQPHKSIQSLLGELEVSTSRTSHLDDAVIGLSDVEESSNNRKRKLSVDTTSLITPIDSKFKKQKLVDRKVERTSLTCEICLKLDILNLQEQRIMRYGIYLYPDFIPISLITALLEITEKQVLQKLLTNLEEFSLITIVRDQGNEIGIQIHPEVQTVCKWYQNWIEINTMSGQDLLWSLIEKLSDHMPGVTELPDNMWDQARIYASTVDFFLARVTQEGVTHPLLVNLIDRMGAYNRYVACDYEAAREYYKQALKIYRDLYIGVGNHPDIAITLNNLGNVYSNLGQNQEALKCHRKAFKMFQTLYTDDHPDIAISLNNLGTVYSDLGQHQETLKCYLKAFKLLQGLYVSNHPFIGSSLNNLGNLYKDLGQSQEALEYHEQALKMYRALFKGNHPYIANTRNNLGNVYKGLGQNQEALKYYLQALEMFQALYMGNHPYIALAFNNIGTVYSDLGENQEALTYHEQALEMFQDLYVGNHPYIASSLNNLGNVYFSLDQNQEALNYYLRALDMYQALFKGNHLDIAMTINNLGTVYRRLGNNKDALSYYLQAFEMRQILYIGSHPDIAMSLNNLGNVYKDLKQHKDALTYYSQSFKMFQELYKCNHPSIAMLLNNLGDVYKDLGQHQKALKYYARTLEMYQAIHTGNHPSIEVIKQDIAQLTKGNV